jgi:hypothetical protein
MWVQGKKHGSPWDYLTAKELQVVVQEIQRCKDDFSYAARNYFWIVNKETKEDQLFKLWESQELLLNEILHMKAQGLSQRIVVIKARQLGISTVAESLIAHRVVFYRNSDCFIVSYDDDHAARLFGYVQHIYDKLPWWMRPECASREFKDGLILDRKDFSERRTNPGMNCRVTAKGATSLTGIGQGHALAGAHLSEWADWNPKQARDIIEEDITYALADGPHTFGILESTAKGAGTYSHEFWKRMVKMGDRAPWRPMFLPWFFDKSRRSVVMPGWKIQQEESDMRARANRDWARCDNKLCLQYVPRRSNGVEQIGSVCSYCNFGVIREFTLSDEQAFYMETKRTSSESDEQSLNKMRQELCSTAEEAFRLSGIRLFNEKQLAYVNSSLSDPEFTGYLDKSLNLHGHNPKTATCWLGGCSLDHRYEDTSLVVWERPVPGEQYVIGADIAEGLGGDHDYSVAQVIKRHRFGGTDEQVAEFASNVISPTAFAELLNRLGQYYNTAMVASEINNTCGGIVLHALRVRLQYPNIFRPLNSSSLAMETQGLGWKTTANSKSRLYDALRTALDHRILLIRSKVTATEILNFRKEDNSTTKMGAGVGHDDRIMALMIAYATAHERDWDSDKGILRVESELTLESAPYIFSCESCGERWPANQPSDYRRCFRCSSMHVKIRSMIQPTVGMDPHAELLKYPDPTADELEVDYHSL